MSRSTRLVPLAVAAAAPAIYARWVRPRLLSWGATPEEASRSYPGDDVVPEPDGGSTMATTLPAPPDEVWAWLAQMGADRGGWYSWDRLDRGGEPSADRIVPEWQSLEVGQHLAQSPDGKNWFTVVAVEPGRTLVLRSNLDVSTGHSYDPAGSAPPRAYLDGIWSFHLSPTPEGATRLVVRTRGRSRPHPLLRPFDLLLGEPAHFVMQTRQFHNLRTRVAAAA
jgi:hypothetical protein